MSEYITTYLLGAGFSRSAHAPLPLSFDFFERVRAKRVGETPYLQLNPSLQLLDKLIQEYFPKSPDLEDVMSFLSQQYFPPGFRQHWQHRTDAYVELLNLVASTYGSSMMLVPHNRNVLKRFAHKLVKDGSNILTFNYDCILESFLAETNGWNCTSGYGMPLRHIYDCFHEVHMSEERYSSMSLLKLHGSVNWGIPDMNSHDRERAEIFFIPPDLAGIGSNIAHVGVNLPVSKRIFHSTGFRPFIVPPIVDKSQSYQNRFFRRLWYLAREILSVSNRIVILGYSFPPTDYMAQFLIREAFGAHLAKNAKREVIVVNQRCHSDYRHRVESIMGKSDVKFVENDCLAHVEVLCRETLKRKGNPNLSLHCSIYHPRIPFLKEENSNKTTGGNIQ